MHASDFISTWRSVDLTERAAAQSHFCELCALLGEETPIEADRKGEWYAFEKGATKTTGGQGWADVWKRGYFGWEYKSKGKDLRAAFAQLQRYAPALENPPLLVVCDLSRFEIHTNWTNTVSRTYEIALEELADDRKLRWLKWAFTDPEQLKPGLTRQTLTEQAAGEFARLAQCLRDRGHPSQTVAHFINRLVFCMFAEDVDLLPGKMFGRMLEGTARSPGEFEALASSLFAAMRVGGRIGFERVDWFNGGLFDDDGALPLTGDDIALVRDAAARDWAEIDPSIFGTLFERGLDPDKRSQLGAHYTDRDKIMLIIEPVIIRPWLAEWEMTKAVIVGHMEAVDKARARRPARQAEASRVYSAARRAEEASLRAARAALDLFIQRLRAFRVLDPACGSGNFLYLALLALKDIEHRVAIEAEALGLGREFPRIGPEAVKGVEINPYAAELARVTVWIGEIQWMRRNGFDVGRNPILRPLDTIECRDAILNEDGSEAEWPEADVVIGNPPFLGDRRMIGVLGERYVSALRAVYGDRIPGRSDLVCYWIAKGLDAIEKRDGQRVGLVATNSISGGNNLPTLARVTERGRIFEAWNDEPWVIEGAAVRVAVVCFGRKEAPYSIRLNGVLSAAIGADLTVGLSLASVLPLQTNKGVSFIGTQKNGPFDVPGEMARVWLTSPLNPHGRPNLDVVRPWTNGSGLVRRDEDRWIIDFGSDTSERDAALYESPFQYVFEHVRPTRLHLRRQWHRTKWWLHGDPRPALRRAVANVNRFIATPRISKYRIFAWVNAAVLPDSATVAIARDDDTSFGILHGRFHEAWALRLGTSLEDRPRYTPSTTFETFPFPDGLTPNRPAVEYADDPRAIAIAEAARGLNELREAWLNPRDLVERVPEVVPGFPDRIVPVNPKAAATLKKRTLTNLYNERPTWLANAHRELDAAVATA
jgi:type II restriction/modification system DNA methylase subunit YeeA